MTTSVARNFSLGAELHEFGLNAVSAQLHRLRPELFETTKEIVIDRTSNRKLILYGYIPEPVSFNFFPIVDSAFPPDSLFVECKIGFALTDELLDSAGQNIGLGEFIRIDAVIQADMALSLEASVEGQSIKIMLNKATFIDFSGDTAESTNQGLGLDVSKALTAHANSLSTDPVFVALLNYVIEVFLRDALERPIAQFPFPPLNLLADTGMALHLRGLRIDGNTLGAYMHDKPGGVIAPTGALPARRTHLSIGVVEPFIRKIVDNLLPVTRPIDPTPGHRTFSIRDGSWIRIKEHSDIRLGMPRRVQAKIYLEADVKCGVNIKLGKYGVRPKFTIPIRYPSRIQTTLIPFIKDTPDAFQIRLRPHGEIFDTDHILLFVDFYTYIRDAVQAWLRRHVTPVMRKIPILGWIISKGIEIIVSELMGIFVGGPLSAVVSVASSLFLTAVYKIAVFAFGPKLDFQAYKLNKVLPVTGVPLALRRLVIPDFVDNQGGELLLDAWFDGEPGEYPEPPVPSQPEIPDDPIPTEPEIPEPYPNVDFQPAFPMAVPDWDASLRLTYTMSIGVGEGPVTRMGSNATITQAVTCFELSGPDRLQLDITTTVEGVEQSHRSIAIDQTAGTLLKETEREEVHDGDTVVTVNTEMVYDVPGRTIQVDMSVAIDAPGDENDVRVEQSKLVTIPPGEPVALLSSGAWMYQFMQPFDQHSERVYKTGRLDIKSGGESDDNEWVRLIPCAIHVKGDETIRIGPEEILCTRVEIEDCGDEGDRIIAATLWIEKRTPYRVMQCVQRSADIEMTSTLNIEMEDTWPEIG